MFVLGKPLLGFLTTLIFSASTTVLGQQQYPGNLVLNCNNTDETGLSPAFGYTCYREMPSCQAFVMFRTTPPYLSVSSISSLVSSDLIEFARINNVSSTDVLAPDTEVVIPVRCSCSGQYYQANTSYVSGADDTYFTVANYTYQGLTTCDALMRENPYGVYNISAGLNFLVPLRCACPTQEQTANGARFMLTYLVTWNDKILDISKAFNVSAKSVATANGLSLEDPMLFPFTTLLIPLLTEPSITSYPSVPQHRHKTSHKGVYAGAGAGAALAVLCFAVFLGFSHYRRRTTVEASDIRQGICQTNRILKVYMYEELQAATNNFSARNRLSKTVYGGTHQGKSLAVKKMSQGVAKEIKILGYINHFNLISLYGACEHNHVFYLVYEYLEGGPLKGWLRSDNSPLINSWNRRILIALDIANGLDYLHNFTNPAYIHKDINSLNILLNGDLRAKITNFSLATETGNPHTRNVVGERGCMAPEYVLTGTVSPKTDVYAFGVVLLELITGKDPVTLHEDKEGLLSDAVMPVWEGMHLSDDMINGLIDPRLQEKHRLGYIIEHTDLAWRLLKLSAACLAQEPDDRLSISQVVLHLVKIQQDVYSQFITIEL